MSRFMAFDQVTGLWGDITWLPQRLPRMDRTRRYLVRVGDRLVGEVWHLEGEGWTAIANGDRARLRGLRSVDGFRTRWAATEYILNIAVRPPRVDEAGKAFSAALSRI